MLRDPGMRNSAESQKESKDVDEKPRSAAQGMWSFREATQPFHIFVIKLIK